jgi:hypothetical protein
VSTPDCATCHTEHKGTQQLVQMSDSHCTQCHFDLKVKDGDLMYKGGISSFIKGHPEWRALLSPEGKPKMDNDPTPIKFNHFKHMEITYDKESKYGARKMQCSDCHRASESNLELMPASSWRIDELSRTN